ncbi:isoprenylcysteine carboxyl methyltransferase family protein [Solibacillus sp. FSL H8-0538]|uniref:isoprenylcysteine carboxyl methyltransferase family protein n=1 Tax=Solibacillus sp. FSL H8-0538 TaxID=2921400 RepID=UPI0030F54FB2
MLFFVIISLVIAQRLIEVLIAKRNEKRMFAQGAYEVGASHYPYMLALHSSFFVSLFAEVLYFERSISLIFPVLFVIFLIVQALRIWCLTSLGQFWNTKIIILPGSNVIKTGPYRFIRHPNYVIVCMEILLLPLMFQAYLTALVFTCLNFAMLLVRIPQEEKALREATDYKSDF